jgi:hypothetical protein
MGVFLYVQKIIDRIKSEAESHRNVSTRNGDDREDRGGTQARPKTVWQWVGRYELGDLEAIVDHERNQTYPEK